MQTKRWSQRVIMLAGAGALLVAVAGVGQATGATNTPTLDRKGQLPAAAMNFRASGKRTYLGVIGVEGTAPDGTVPDKGGTVGAKPYYLGTTLTIPVTAPGLVPGDASIAGGGIESTGCVGTYARPTAAPGTLCIYPGPERDPSTDPADYEIADTLAEVQNVLTNGEGAYDATPYVIGKGNYGVRIEVQAAAPGRVKFTAVWAYTPRKSAK